MVDFGNTTDVQRWLQAQPHEVAVVMAAGAALRVLPIEPEGDHYAARTRATVVLQCFRAAVTAWVAGKFPTHGVALRDIAAAGSAANRSIAAPPYATDTYYAVPAGIDAAAYATAAAGASKTATDNAVAAAYAAIAAAGAGGDDARAADAADAAFIENAGNAGDRRLAITLAGRPLWPDGMPNWAKTACGRMRAALLGT